MTLYCRSRIRCYSEVTSTPYSSHENLSSVTTGEGEPPGAGHTGHTSPGHGGHSPSAEAPELSASFIGEVQTNKLSKHTYLCLQFVPVLLV